MQQNLFLLLIQCGFVWSFSTINDIISNTNKRLPTQNTSRPLDVKLGFYLESIGNFRSSEMSFDVDMYAYMSWTDVRLKHNFPDYVLVNDDSIRQQLWLPDLYFANAIQAKGHQVTVPNFNLFIDRDGSIAYSCRFTMQISCNLQLKNYPMDVQKCGIRILSYAYIAKQVNVTWFDRSPIRYNPEIGLPEFEITNVSASYCNGTYRYAVMPDRHKIDDFSCLLGNIYLSRSIGYNLVQSYIPTGLIVMISWVSFWIDRRAVPARVTLSFTTLVSLTTLGNGLRFGLPQVSYAKAIDLWYGACMLFVFAALLEFAIINSYMRKAEKYDAMSKKFLQQRKEGNLMTDSAIPLEVKKLNGYKDQNANKSPRSVRYGADEYHTELTRSPSVGKKSDGLNQNGAHSRSSTHSPSVQPRTPMIDPEANSHRKRSRHNVRTGISLLPRNTTDRIKFVDDDFQMAVMNGKESDSLSSYDNLSPTRKTFRRDELDISDDDEEAWNKAVQQRNKPFVVYATDKGSAIYYNQATEERKRKMSTYRYSVCENAYTTMSKNFSRTALGIDKMCRYGFPLAFLFWNLFYWWYYLFLQKSRQYLSMIEW